MGGHKLIRDLNDFATGKNGITAEQVNSYLSSGAIDTFAK
jgi:hypothetical protein